MCTPTGMINMQDFNLKKIAESGQVFRANELPDGSYEFIAEDRRLILDPAAPFLKDIQADPFWRSYFDLEKDYASVRASATDLHDDFMAAACEAGEGIRILNQSPWEMLISFIISQRKSIPAIKTSIERLCENFGEKKDGFFAFPTPEALFNADSATLASCGLGYRLEYIRDAAERVLHKKIDLEALKSSSNDELSAALKEIKGVGDKVANCIMLFAYHRIDRVPVDTWVKKIMEEDYNGEDPFSKYGENAGIMQQYAFYYKRNII